MPRVKAALRTQDSISRPYWAGKVLILVGRLVVMLLAFFGITNF
jgi:hypothetical protein